MRDRWDDVERDEVALFETELGSMSLSASPRGLTRVTFVEDGARVDVTRIARSHLVTAREQLADYLAGRRATFDVPLDLRGTAFQRTVWEALLEIPYGETISYAELARRVGRPRAVRAVGAANGRNSIAIVVPCHRVIGSGGELRGYAGEVWRKRALLELERRCAGASSPHGVPNAGHEL